MPSCHSSGGCGQTAPPSAQASALLGRMADHKSGGREGGRERGRREGGRERGRREGGRERGRREGGRERFIISNTLLTNFKSKT